MTTEITFRAGTEGLMAALSVAEKLTSASPVQPTQLIVTTGDFAYVPGTYNRPTGVELYFHQDVDKVREFAQAFGATATERPRQGAYSLFTYADGSLDGVPFRAWTLTNEQAEASQVAGEVSSAVAA